MANRKPKTANLKPQTENRKPDEKNQIIFIVGPTAVGKTEIAVKIAQKINAEIISCDSMQIYRGMDILSCTPPAVLQKKVKYHLIGFLNPGQDYNVSKYRARALEKIKEIRQKGKLPLFVGGTGLYMSILIDGLFRAKAQNKNARNKLYQLASNKGSLYLYGRLKEIDPVAAGKIHPRDTRRIIRALEVYETTGRPISELQKERKGLSQEYGLRVFCLNMARDKLYERIDRRVEKMFRQGLVSEVRKLIKIKLSKTASRAIGIPEITGYSSGTYDLSQAKRLIQRNSRRFAKRQLTWFRKDKRIEWLEIGERESPAAVAKRILSRLDYRP
jgi:tRNA dimethylallyltransferase